MKYELDGLPLNGKGDMISFRAPREIGEHRLDITVKAGSGSSTVFRTFEVMDDGVIIDRPPEIERIDLESASVLPGQIIEVEVIAMDPDDDPMSYTWTTTGGTLKGSGASMEWRAPASPGTYEISVRASSKGLSDEMSTSIEVKSEKDETEIAAETTPFPGMGISILILAASLLILRSLKNH
jgi:hypothetical protein